jgi:hypothetical protein
MTTSTNSQGAFELRDVAPGSYFVSASRAGYLELQYGQRRPRERGVSVDVRGADTIQRIDIALPKGSVLAGRITDELGEPYPGVRVSVLEVRYQQGRRVPFPSGGATTDDLGAYRIPGLLPGTYQVSATSSETWRNERQENYGYATTYYPATASENAQSITLRAAEDRTDIDFSLTASRTARLRGRVIRPTGEPMPGEQVSLSVAFRGTGLAMAGNPISTRTLADGTFELRDVAPADYMLRAGGRTESASLFVAVSGDIDNLVLAPLSGSSVTGAVITDEGTPPPFPASGVRLNLLAPEPERVLPTVRLPAVNNDWTFALANLGGPFLFRVQGLPGEWMIDAVRLNDADLTDAPFDVPTGGREITGLQIVITQRVGTVSGTVVMTDGKPTADATVVVFPDDETKWMFGSRFVRSARPTSAGTFSITGLPAGNYFAVAREAVIDGQWESREFLESVRQDATRIVLAAGASEAVSLTVGRSP